ncbi:MAG TPA: ferric reductase-like transmembrane domain-containing protein [Streptosporangiaceae bacterium]|jgi:predicted ferric reductase
MTVLWYMSRATGIVALVLLTAVFVLGIAVRGKTRLPGLPRFATADLHRNVSLLAVVFIAIHVLTAVLDSYVRIPLLAAIVPFTSGYERLWLGLGAVALDLMLAMIVTSLLRGRLNRVLWRAIHLTAYLCWPVALVHSVFSSDDLRQVPLIFIGIASVVLIIAAVAWRVVHAARQVRGADRVTALLDQPQDHAREPERAAR